MTNNIVKYKSAIYTYIRLKDQGVTLDTLEKFDLVNIYDSSQNQCN